MSYFDTEKKPGKLLKTQEILPLSKCGNPDRMKKKQFVKASSGYLLTYFVLFLQKKMPERVGLSRTAVATAGAGSDRTSSSSSSTLRPASGSLQVTFDFSKGLRKYVKVPNFGNHFPCTTTS